VGVSFAVLWLLSFLSIWAVYQPLKDRPVKPECPEVLSLGSLSTKVVAIDTRWQLKQPFQIANQHFDPSGFKSMLLIALAIMCLATSLNADKVADWYWDQKYNHEKQAAIALLHEPLRTATATITSVGPYERGQMINFNINGDYGPLEVRNYQPSALEEGYVAQAFPARYLIVYHENKFGNKCVLKPTMENAKRLAGRPKPARMPDDKVSRFISLATKVLGGLLLIAGIFALKNDM
jgi:hypothetical protein